MDATTNKSIASIRDTNARIRAIVERETRGKPFWISGMVYKIYQSPDSGHQYIVLQDFDSKYTLKCMLRQPLQEKLPFTIHNGMKLELYGVIAVYEKQAKVEFEIEEVRWVESVLPALNEETQARLEQKGLWPKTPKPIPTTLNLIGLITSKRSDAKDDFYEIYRQEGGKAQIKQYDVRLQGPQAAREIADKISFLNKQTGEDRPDVIVLTRGGGRDADLAVFSDYLVAEAICRSEIPIVTGIGHTSDQTFADLAADRSTQTPTAAAVFLAKGTVEEKTSKQNKARFWLEGIIVLIVAVALISVIALLLLQ